MFGQRVCFIRRGFRQFIQPFLNAIAQQEGALGFNMRGGIKILQRAEIHMAAEVCTGMKQRHRLVRKNSLHRIAESGGVSIISKQR